MIRKSLIVGVTYLAFRAIVPSRRRRLVADARGRRLRSSASRTCVVSCDVDIHNTFGDRAFAAAGPSSIASERGGLIVQ